jgi:hypothetical protein
MIVPLYEYHSDEFIPVCHRDLEDLLKSLTELMVRYFLLKGFSMNARRNLNPDGLVFSAFLGAEEFFVIVADRILSESN